MRRNALTQVFMATSSNMGVVEAGTIAITDAMGIIVGAALGPGFAYGTVTVANHFLRYSLPVTSN